MKHFFSSKLNIILSILLVISLSCIIFLIVDITNQEVKALDFSNYELKELNNWIAENDLSDRILISYEFDEDITENYVIYQSVKEGENIDEQGMEIIISKGKDPNALIPLPEINDDLNESTLSKWCLTNEINDVSYQYVLSDKAEGNVVGFNVETNIARNEHLIADISIGTDKTKVSIIVPSFVDESKEDILSWGDNYQIEINFDYEVSTTLDNDSYISQKPEAGETIKNGESIEIILAKNKANSSTKSIVVPDTYLWYSEENFIKAIENLGLVALKGESTHTNTSHNTGEVYAYQSTSDGYTFQKGDSVIYYLINNESSSTITVPDTYLGMNESEFISTIEKLGLKVSKQEKTYKSVKYQTATIYAYDSTSDGINFKSGDIVKYWLVDNGEETSEVSTIKVPDTYLGMEESEFISTIEKLGLVAIKQSKTYKSYKYKTGQIYAYDSTSDGLSFKSGDSVKYYLVDNGDSNSNSDNINVPDTYLGMNESEFISTIEGLGLKVSKQEKTYKSVKYQTATIYAYDSTSDGINFKSGDTVKYWLVDNNDNTITVPDSYIGLSESEFIACIEKLGLVPTKQSKTYTSSKYKTGQVYIYESSSDGIVFAKGDSVKYYLIDNGEESSSESITLQNLVGKTKSDVETYCASNGLKVSYKESYSNSVTKDYVISMSPTKGSKINKGDSLTIEISLGKQVATSAILSPNLLIGNYSRTSFSESETAIKQYFADQGFTNVSVKAVSSSKTIGQIISISVNGNEKFAAGEYPIDASIVIQIVNANTN